MSINDSKNFNVDLDNYQGPLDILLDLAKAQKVNLEDISITLLADQFHNYIKSQSNLNLEVASEYLLMATWLTYLKSKLLLPGNPEEEFKVLEVAEKLKLQLKKLELIRLLSDQMLKRKRLGREIRVRGIKGNIRSIYSAEYKLNLYELLKSYSFHELSSCMPNFSSLKQELYKNAPFAKMSASSRGFLFEDLSKVVQKHNIVELKLANLAYLTSRTTFWVHLSKKLWSILDLV